MGGSIVQRFSIAAALLAPGCDNKCDVTDFGCVEDPFQSVVAGLDFTCARRSESVECWGNSPAISGPVPWELAARERLLCGLGVTPRCYGAPAITPTATERGTRLSVGADHACAVEFSVKCWGDNTHGQTTPPASDRLQFVDVVAGYQHTCATAQNYTGTGPSVLTLCWGRNDHGQATPPETGTSFWPLVAGDGFTCGLAQGVVHCWGRQLAGSPPATASQLAAGRDHACAITADSMNIECWGADTHGQATPPSDVSGPFYAIAAGTYHTCAIREPGSIICWGANEAGQSTPPSVE